jgi:sarcosine oxidase subunit alpha
VSGAYRLPGPAGLLIDRETPVDFTFEGVRYAAFAGDTVASALAAHGVRMLSRSFKYHRPRGILSMAGHDANTLVTAGYTVNAPAEKVPVSAGLEVRAQNYVGSLERDWAALLGRLGRFLPVGFYYKAFHSPKLLWPYWERLIRNLTGLGRIDLETPQGYFDKEYQFHDLIVIGGGPAGLSAALRAAKAGAEVVLVDENPALGGSLNYARFGAEEGRAAKMREKLVAEVEAQANIRVMTSSFCQGWFIDNWFPLIRGNRLYKLRAKGAVVATGSYEQAIVFRNNDLPGVMLGSAAQRLIKLYGVKPGERAVVATAADDGYGVALDLLEVGVEVACVVDLRADPPETERTQALTHRHVPILVNATVREAVPGPQGKNVSGARIAKITGEGRSTAETDRFNCDLIAMVGGYHPQMSLLTQTGGRARYDPEGAIFRVDDLPEGVVAAGSVNGNFALDAVIEEGSVAGWKAAKAIGLEAGRKPVEKADRKVPPSDYPWPIFPHPGGKDFVDFDEDLQVKDILNAVAEGYEHIELQKRFSTLGMGPSQGRHSHLAAARLNARARGARLDEAAVTTLRWPISQIKIGHLAGRIFEPVRTTTIHHRHIERGAKMMVAGPWLRPEYYGSPATRAEDIRKEVLNVRNNVGVIDVSTLGGLEVQGPDAAEFMNRIYTFAYLKQPIGRSRYVMMTDLGGVVADDGVTARFHKDHYYVTATTSGADAVYQTMLWYNAQWRLKVNVINVTASYAAVNIAGPKSREVLAKLCDDIDLSKEAYPYMDVREGHIADIPARLLRIGFVGELGYEIHVPSGEGEALWDALFEAGEEFGIMPFGIEAQRLLRLEKGHIIISQDTDGLTTPQEADMTWAIAKKKPFYVGRQSVDIQAAKPLKRKLIGFELANEEDPVPLECHLTLRGEEIVGRVTSIGHSPTLGKTIGLAYVAPDQAEPGQLFDIKIEKGRIVKGRVVKLPFYDPDGARQEL